MGDLSKFQKNNKAFKYTENPDTTVNSHGHEIISICEDNNLVPVNHLCTGDVKCEGSLTYRQKDKRISQIDCALCHRKYIGFVSDFQILDHINFPSNYAPISVTIECDSVAPQLLLEHAQLLNTVPKYKPNWCTRQIRMWQLIIQKFQTALPDPVTLMPANEQEAEFLVENITETLYSACEAAIEKKITLNFTNPLNAHHRWQNLQNLGDTRKIWQAIDWSGRYSKSGEQSTVPSNEEFAEYFQQLLNLVGIEEVVCPEIQAYVPLLDDPISEAGVFDEIKRMSAEKAPGTDGIPLGTFRYLPDQWIWLLTFLLNMIFL